MTHLNAVLKACGCTILDKLALQDISSLSKTCKETRSLVLTGMLSAIPITWNTHIPLIRKTRLSKFLESLIKYPSLRPYVKSIHLNELGSNNPIFDAKSGPPVPRARLKLFREQINRLPLPDTVRPHQDVAIIALLLSYCPELENLKIHIDLVANDILLQTLSHLLRGNRPGHGTNAILQRLEHVSLTAPIQPDEEEAERQSYLPLSVFLPFLYLPSLEVMEAFLPKEPNDVVPWPMDRPPADTALRTLQLPYTTATPGTLSAILFHTPQLTTLEYHYWCNFMYDLDCEILRSALLKVKDTLSTLVISFMPYATCAGETECQNWQIIGALGSLKPLTKLRHLEISLPVLFGWDRSVLSLDDVLPSSLQALWIRQECFGFLNMGWSDRVAVNLFVEFLKSVKNSSRALKSFNLRFPDAYNSRPWNPVQVDWFQNRCKKAGLSCTIVSFKPGFYWYP
ncbi:hypothetical protein BU26DRAFT_511269 [Trematosphaeria pertusa]|uniref:F-box domain-containing protein n=1 Tax=Trematosphaeria pertusa TaxID=390896 RepID=A0A6A6HWE9_9PLEO|nr:uncharacterized protein BU26DRAFT_511269 [Trematosphaeria pertusa]KAF2241893.1 hypothetical protein BU26DRAFT_511269 [Trematosphaeria pertusa]